MAMWSCPHCGAAQAASARCWVCHRSSTTCSTCRHFRTSLAADVGWCALDRRRRPLTGLELRGCWTERAAATQPADTPRPLPAGSRDQGWRDVSVLRFVPVDVPTPPVAEPSGATAPDVSLRATDPTDTWDARVSLFGDLER